MKAQNGTRPFCLIYYKKKRKYKLVQINKGKQTKRNVNYPPMVLATCGGEWNLRTGIGMNISLPDHPMPVTQCYLAMNDTTFYSDCLLICIISK